MQTHIMLCHLQSSLYYWCTHILLNLMLYTFPLTLLWTHNANKPNFLDLCSPWSSEHLIENALLFWLKFLFTLRVNIKPFSCYCKLILVHGNSKSSVLKLQKFFPIALIWKWMNWGLKGLTSISAFFELLKLFSLQSHLWTLLHNAFSKEWEKYMHTYTGFYFWYLW